MPQSPLNFRQKQREHERNAASGEVPTGGTRSQNSQVEILIADAREDDRRGVNKCVCVCECVWEQRERRDGRLEGGLALIGSAEDTGATCRETSSDPIRDRRPGHLTLV